MAASPRPEVGLARSAGLTAAATLASRILGLVRDQVLAALFGASNEMDAFIVAFRIPNLMRDLFAEGAMSAALVPTFTRVMTVEGRRAAWRLGNNVLNALMIVTGSLVAIGVVFAAPMVAAYAGDFAAVPGKLELTVRLTRVMLPFLVLVAAAAAMMGMLNSLHHYFVPAFAPAVFNVATIAGAFTLVPVMPRLGLPPIMAIALAAVAGGIGQVAMQWPALAREGFRYRTAIDWRDPDLRRMLLLMGPGTLGIAATQVNVVINTLLATGEGTGAVSWLTYAFRLIYLPIGLFGVSIATAVLPAVSHYAAIDDLGRVRDTLARGVSLMLMLSVPATLGLLVLATPIVQLLFQHGRFMPTDTAPTATALRFYAVGLIGYSTARIASPAFYALQQSRVPAIVSVCTIAANIGLSVALVPVLGMGGLALATALAALANGGLLLLLLRRRLHGIGGSRLMAALAKIIAASLVMAAVVRVVELGAGAVVGGDSVTAQSIRLVLEIGAGLAALAALARLLAIGEFVDAMTLVRSRFAGSRDIAI